MVVAQSFDGIRYFRQSRIHGIMLNIVITHGVSLQVIHETLSFDQAPRVGWHKLLPIHKGHGQRYASAALPNGRSGADADAHENGSRIVQRRSDLAFKRDATCGTSLEPRTKLSLAFLGQ